MALQAKWHLPGSSDGMMMPACSYAISTGECIKSSDMTAADRAKNLVGAFTGGSCPARSVNARSIRDARMADYVGSEVCGDFDDNCGSCMALQAKWHLPGSSDGMMMPACSYVISTGECIKSSDMTAADRAKNLVGAFTGGSCPARSV